MKDVATYSRWKPALNAAPQFVFGLIGLVGAFVLGKFILLPEIERFHEGYSKLAICLFPASIGVLFFTSGVRLLLAAFEKDCFLRAGPEGISWRLPGKARWCSYEMDERFLDWKDIKELRLMNHSINGIPTGTDLVIVATNGWRKRLERVYFQESAAFIREAIAQAAG